MIVFLLGRRLARAAAGILVLVVAVALAGIAATAERAVVTIEDFAFGPGTITVPRGTVVTWTNKDDEPHTVVASGADKLWKSPALDEGESFSFTFDRPGTYSYFCTVHPRMQGTVVVQ